MTSAVNPPNTIEEENEEENPEGNDDFGSEEDSQNENSGSENSDVDQEDEENQEDRDTLVHREGESGDQGETTHSEQEENSFENPEEDQDEEEEEGEEEEEEQQEEEEQEERLPEREPELRPAIQYRRQQQQQQLKQQQQRQQGRTIPRNMYNRGQQRQRKRWVSPQRSNPRLQDHRMRDYKDSFMGDPISLRLHSAQMEAIKEELSNAIQETIAKSDYINELEKRLKTMEIDNNQLQRLNAITQKKMDSIQKNLTDSTRQCDSLADELNCAKMEIEKLKQHVKDETTASSNLEKRLSQATGEIEKTKTELQKYKELSKDQETNWLKKIDEMQKEKRKWEKQNSEMHLVIKKHMQLISNLRRQVMHVEAAAALRISEDQFIRAMEKHH